MMKNFDQITTAAQSRLAVLAWATSVAGGAKFAAARTRSHVVIPAFAGAPGTSVWSPPTG